MSATTTFTTDSGTTTLTPEQMDGFVLDDVRPVARERARTMLALYTGKPVPDAESVDAERLADFITDLVHLAREVDALPEHEGTDTARSALFVADDEDREPSGWYWPLPAATRAAVPGA